MKALPRLLLALALTAGIVLAVAYREHLDAAALTAWVASAGAAGPLVFMAIYALATILFLPGSLLTLAERGFAQIHVVQGGMTAWIDQGWPVERNPIQPE